MPKILVIDDEVQIRILLRITLESNGYNVILASTGKEGISLAVSHTPELIILDLGLPDISGHQVLNELKEWYTKSIIILSVQNTENDIITALDNGADDYLTKPFRTGELMARIRSCIKRNIDCEVESSLVFEDVEIDFIARTVKKDGKDIKLTNTEYNLLALFARYNGRALTHRFILKEIWGVGSQSETQILRVFVAQLRKKLESNPNNPTHIITESGVGYRFY